MRILFTCSASSDYVRNRTIVRALGRKHEVEAVASAAASYSSRLATVVPRIMTASSRFDVYLAGFLGQPLMPFLRTRSLKPIILDAFISIYDTLCLDRRTFSPRSPVGRVSRWLDAQALRWAHCVPTDTSATAQKRRALMLGYRRHASSKATTKLTLVATGHDVRILCMADLL